MIDEIAVFRAILDGLPNQCVVVVNRELRYLEAFGPLLLSLEMAPENIVGRTIYDVLDPTTSDEIARHYMTALAGVTAHFERKYGGLFLEQTIAPLLQPGGDLLGAVSYIRDVSHREINRLAAVALAIRDPLTGLYNDRHFARRLEKVEPMTSVLYLDVDGLKAINDTGGHKAGDAALVAVAAALAANSREKKDVAARLHGDEFALLLANTGRAGAALVAARIRAALVASGAPAVSIGIATCPDDTCDPRALGELADARLYADKRARRR